MINIIPAIDIIDGKCVRLTKGDYNQKKEYSASPLDMALRYQDIGVRRLHLVDLDGAKSSSPKNLRVLEEIATRTSLDIEWGGGIKSDEALRDAFNAGANHLIVGSVAVANSDLFARWLDNFGGDHLILGADVADGRVAINGWLEQSELTIEALIDRFRPHGLREVICTDIAKDGMLQGPTFELYSQLQNAYPEQDIIVSGGISCMDDIYRLDEMQLRHVIVGKAIYEGRIALEDVAAVYK
ncbi:MAG: 1-(5-phosphoribosyl)-5-[Bacteroidaceae bacterium]|nr:1-(5-phosphoribosyl)-5-[(5-phosphoribosylamino)methylideneamino]imidazole-4-carboxamide isomerase [Bacteroidaceae bacterium]